LKRLHKKTVNTIATRGIGTNNLPPELLRHRLEQLGMHTSDMNVKNRCYAEKRRTSWDAYAFHFGTLNFDETGFRDDKTGKKFTMNTIGAENSALYYLERASPGISFKQICDHVHMWHLHQSPKMHSSKRQVSAPRSIADKCCDIMDCLGQRLVAKNVSNC